MSRDLGELGVQASVVGNVLDEEDHRGILSSKHRRVVLQGSSS
jgi:hypothetical protein